MVSGSMKTYRILADVAFNVCGVIVDQIKMAKSFEMSFCCLLSLSAFVDVTCA